jgi:hypothetical protein
MGNSTLGVFGSVEIMGLGWLESENKISSGRETSYGIRGDFYSFLF